MLLQLSFIFDENRKTKIFTVLVSVIYFIIAKYVCVDDLYLQQGLIYLTNKVSKNTTFDDISGIGIFEVLMRIMYCRGFPR